jgi:hemerythrin-like domain-containing protein
MDEAFEEHHVAHTLINELKRRTGSKGRYEAKFKVLGESIKHHVKEEEGTMFPLAEEEADLDWEALAEKVMKATEILMARSAGNGARGRRRETRSAGRNKQQPLRKAA